MVNIAGGGKPFLQCGGIEIVGFDKIVQGITMIAQLGIHEPDEQVRVHVEVVRQVHERSVNGLYLPEASRFVAKQCSG